MLFHVIFIFGFSQTMNLTESRSEIHFEKNNYSLTVPESIAVGSEIIKVSASGAKDVVYSLHSYSAKVSGHLFQVNESTGAIRLISNLDYETQNTHRLIVKAWVREPPLTALTTVSIKVEDENDCLPIISIIDAAGKEIVSMDITENVVENVALAFISVYDCDSGRNSEIIMNCNDSDRFVLQLMHRTEHLSTYMLISQASFDREKEEKIVVAITATDNGMQPLSNTVNLIINIADENDCAPKFLRPVWSTNISENNLPGTKLIQIIAQDNDTSDNGLIKYRLKNDTALFWIDENTGEIFVNTSLDREERSNYKLTAEAYDRGKLKSEAIIDVNVLDVNDNPPKFLTNSYNFTLSYNAAPRSIVGQVVCNDKDSDERSYSHFKGSTECFYVTHVAGFVVYTCERNRASKRTVNFTVTAINVLSPYHKTTAQVFVWTNENAIINHPILLDVSKKNMITVQNINNDGNIAQLYDESCTNCAYSVDRNEHFIVSRDGRLYMTKLVEDMSYSMDVVQYNGNKKRLLRIQINSNGINEAKNEMLTVLFTIITPTLILLLATLITTCLCLRLRRKVEFSHTTKHYANKRTMSSDIAKHRLNIMNDTKKSPLLWSKFMKNYRDHQRIAAINRREQTTTKRYSYDVIEQTAKKEPRSNNSDSTDYGCYGSSDISDIEIQKTCCLHDGDAFPAMKNAEIDKYSDLHANKLHMSTGFISYEYVV